MNGQLIATPPAKIQGAARALASWLDVTLDQLAAMALLARSDADLAERFGADPSRLAEALE